MCHPTKRAVKSLATLALTVADRLHHQEGGAYNKVKLV